jgi:hypothetical protein
VSHFDLRALVVVLLTSIATPLAAQDKPDVSGSWILESAQQPGGDVPNALTVSQSMNGSFKDIAITRTLANGARSDTYLIGVGGGTLSGVRHWNDPVSRAHFNVEWQEQTLLIESGSYTRSAPETGEWAERREAWSLDSEGRLRVAIATRSSADVSTAAMLLYRRQ